MPGVSPPDLPRQHLPGGHEMCPDVERFVGHLEDAEEAVGRRAPRRAVPAEDALLLVALRGEERC